MSSTAKLKALFLVATSLLGAQGACTQQDTLGFWDAPAGLHKGRFWLAAGSGMAAYTGTLIVLDRLWYSEHERTSFHFFNDGREWLQMDKAGHMFTAYFEADWLYHVAKWTGMQDNSAIWTGALAAAGLQATIEIMDGFAKAWGFSLYDITANLAGSGLWAIQQTTWNEQRIRMKVSSTYRTYPDLVLQGSPAGTMTLRERTNALYGKNIFQSFLKDYNAQTIWLSVNIHAFLKEESRFPKWLNVAVGYGTENVFGGFENKWTVDGNTFRLQDVILPRYRQWYLSPDIDLRKINVRSKPLKAFLHMANIFKFPAPALEMNGQGGIRWRWVYF